MDTGPPETQNIVRHRLAPGAVVRWPQLFPWDSSDEYADYMQITTTEGAWGDGRHSAPTSLVYQVRIRATGYAEYTFGDTRELWQLKFDARLDYYDYDVIVSRQWDTSKTTKPTDTRERAGKQEGIGHPVATAKRVANQADDTAGAHCEKAERWGSTGYRKKAHLGTLTQHAVLTLNVGGSKEALILKMETDADILLIQEHRIARPSLPSIQGMAMRKGWHGVWGAATANAKGRIGGTTVLVRRPTQILRGGRMTRGQEAQ